MGSFEHDLKDLKFQRKPEGLRKAVIVGRRLLETISKNLLSEKQIGF